LLLLLEKPHLLLLALLLALLPVLFKLRVLVPYLRGSLDH
jgi:hypothetical protein